jgi:hypothetical protein
MEEQAMEEGDKKDWRTRAREALSRATAMRDPCAKTGMIEVATYYGALERATRNHWLSRSMGKERQGG